LKRIVRKDLSVRQVEAAVRSSGGSGASRVESKSRGPAWIGELESRLRQELGTKVELRNGAEYRGQIVLHYFGRDDLERLVARLAPPSTI
jgi:ParB-like chromosome segregation protein Spo0J